MFMLTLKNLPHIKELYRLEYAEPVIRRILVKVTVYSSWATKMSCVAGELVYQAKPNLVKIMQVHSKTGEVQTLAHTANALDVLTIPPTSNQVSTFPKEKKKNFRCSLEAHIKII